MGDSETENNQSKEPRAARKKGAGTMELDALVDEMEEISVPGAADLPPPLPPKPPAKRVYLIAALVVVVAAGLGIGAGAFLYTSTADNDAAATLPDRPPTTESSEQTAAVREGAAEAETAPEGAEPDVVHLDEVLIGGEEAEEATETPDESP